MRVLLALCTALLVSAGCVSPGDEGDEGRAPVDVREAAGTYEAWQVGEYWEYTLDVRGFERYDRTRLTYYDQAGEEFTVGAPNYDEALYHAVFSHNPLLGRVHGHLLSPHEEGEHSFMFPFHKGNVIQDGDEWTTRFFGHQVTVRATFDEAVPAPGGATPGFRFVATDANDAHFRIEYSYVRDVRWFTYLRVTDAEGVFVDLVLMEHGTGATGQAYFIRAKDYLHETIPSSGPLQTTRTFTVAANDADRKRVESFAISADISLQSGIGATVRLKDPSGTTIWERQYASNQDGERNIVEVWPTGTKSTAPVEARPQWQPGTYTLEFSYTGQATTTVHIVGTQDNSGRVGS